MGHRDYATLNSIFQSVLLFHQGQGHLSLRSWNIGQCHDSLARFLWILLYGL